jgi:lysozyme family protein
MADFDQCLARTLKWEGGNDDDKDDPGGRTSRGIIQHEYDAYCDRRSKPRGDVWKATDAEIRDIYQENYWFRVRGDKLDAGVAMCLFDTSVNNGVGQCAKFVQRALGPLYDGVVDGDFGPKTFDGLAKVNDNDALIGKICEMRQGLFNEIAARRPASRKFLGGWTSRNRDILAVSQAWASGSVGPDPHPSAGADPVPKAKPSDVPPPATGHDVPGTIVAVGGAGAAAATAADQISNLGQAATGAAQQLQPHAYLSPKLAMVCAILTIIGIGIGFYVSWRHRRHQALMDGRLTAPVGG